MGRVDEIGLREGQGKGRGERKDASKKEEEKEEGCFALMIEFSAESNAFFFILHREREGFRSSKQKENRGFGEGKNDASSNSLESVLTLLEHVLLANGHRSSIESTYAKTRLACTSEKKKRRT